MLLLLAPVVQTLDSWHKSTFEQPGPGDLCQLPPIQRKLVFDNYANNAFNLCHTVAVGSMISNIVGPGFSTLFACLISNGM